MLYKNRAVGRFRHKPQGAGQAGIFPSRDPDDRTSRTGQDRSRHHADAGGVAYVEPYRRHQAGRQHAENFCQYMNYRHGHCIGGKVSSLYIIWWNMKSRCYNLKYKQFKDYGGRGIKVTRRWWKFSNFLEDMGPRPSGRTLHRIDNDGDYCKENCKWATRLEQGQNKSNNHYFTYKGLKLTLTNLARRSKLKVHTLRRRLLHLGWTVEEAVETPTIKSKRNKRGRM